jgi:hypothetical protein
LDEQKCDGTNVNSITPHPNPSLHGTWTGIKACLQTMDKNGLVDLIHRLYESDPEIQQGLSMKFDPTDKCVNRARRRVMNLVYPNPMGSLPIRAGDALKVIKKFYKISEDQFSTCAMLLDGIEAGTVQAEDIGIEDDSYFNALGQMMRMLISLQSELPQKVRRQMLTRVVRIHEHGKNVAYGHGYGLTETLREMRRLCR